MSNLSRAVAVTKDGTFIDARRPIPAPSPEKLAEGIVPFLSIIFRMLGGPGVLLLDGPTAGALGLPTGKLPEGPDIKAHPAVATLRAAGFKVTEVFRWFHVKHGDTQISIGLLEFIDAEYFPMVAARMSDTTAALATWHRLSGMPWTGSANDAGNELLKSIGSMRHDGRIVLPAWRTWKGPEGDPVELPYLPSSWHRDLLPHEVPGSGVAYGYDRVRAHLAAMTTTSVAGFHLAHDLRLNTVNLRRSGWWRVTVAPWHMYHLMPDPAGYGEILPDGSRWLPTPRIKLISDLEAEGVHGGILDVHEAWTAPSQDNILQPYAAKLRTMYDVAREIVDDTERALIHGSIKAAYRQHNGAWSSGSGDVRRRDWSAAVSATSSTTLWRKCWKAGWATGAPVGPWPLWIDTDAVYYPGPADPTQVIEPAGFLLADKLGGWRPMAPRDVSRETGRSVSRTREEATA